MHLLFSVANPRRTFPTAGACGSCRSVPVALTQEYTHDWKGAMGHLTTTATCAHGTYANHEYIY